MAQVKYHGEFPADQDTITHLGIEFGRDKAVSVTDKDTLAKLAANRFFEVSGESDKDDVKAGQAEAEAAEVETLKAWLDEQRIPYRANASLKNLRDAKAEREKEQAEAEQA